jgi:hypothetical protein
MTRMIPRPGRRMAADSWQYVGIWTVENVQFTKLAGLKFDLVGKIGSPGAKIPRKSRR